MGHSYTSYDHTDHILGTIRRMRAELSNLFTPGRYSGNADKTALTRRKSCPVGALNIVISRPWHSSQQKKTTSEYPAQRTIHPKSSLHSPPSFSLSQNQPPSHRQISRRHSDMSAVRRQESWQRRPRGSFLNTDAVGDGLEEHNEVARSIWRNNIERRRKIISFRNDRSGRAQQDFSSFSS